ncbi:recombinase family protein [Petrocella sp. FN5]|uniref:recombinase family protein n=1 Tax=Petrocella sp. FN5 TaxID=3032002 RepID=UPI0023DB2098|nr:recombinase family protein [Petrocella sp. FN5]MDF1617218.1 recombinase family protein [Petrocella sp. FN5]
MNKEVLGNEYAAMLIRVSTNNESQDSSYEEQYEILEERMKQMGYKLFKVYKERITATKVDGRREFDEMMADAQMGKFKAIFAKDLSRIARNQEVSHWFKRIILENQIELFAVDESAGIINDPLMYGFKSLTNEHYSADLSKKIKNAFKVKMKKGEYTRSEAPFGYYVKEKKLYICEDDSPDIVRKIFHLYLREGKGVDSIAKLLDREDVAPPGLRKGKKNAGIHWHGTSIKYILTNQAYTGDLIQNKEESIGVFTKKRKTISSPIIIKNAHEAIISQELFDETQRYMAERAFGPRPTPQKHLFTDLIECGSCGKKYWYRSAGNRYICAAYARHGRSVCSSNAIREDVLIGLIQGELSDLIQQYKINDSLNEEIDEKLKRKVYKVNNEKKLLLAKKEKYEDAKSNLILSKVMKEITEDEFDASVELLRTKIDNINSRLDELKNANVTITENEIQTRLKEQFAGITDFSSINRELLNRFIKYIIVRGKNEVEIHYRFKK